MVFGFRIITTNDGTEIIDRNKTTDFRELTPMQIIEYNELDVQMFIMDRMERIAREEAEHRRKLMRNPFHKIAVLCGLV